MRRDEDGRERKQQKQREHASPAAVTLQPAQKPAQRCWQEMNIQDDSKVVVPDGGRLGPSRLGRIVE
jgi:hypothetical protein